MKPAIEFKQVDILFPPNTRGSQALVNQAFEALQQGKRALKFKTNSKSLSAWQTRACRSVPGTSASSWACRDRENQPCCAQPID